MDILARHGDDVVWVVAVLVLALVAALALRHSIRQRFGHSPRLVETMRRAHRALFMLIAVVALRLMLVRVSAGRDEWDHFLAHTLDLAFVATLAWIVAEVVFAMERFLLDRYVADRDMSEIRVRKLNTQVRLASHLMIATIIVVAVGAMLLNFREVRIIGGGLLASAGLISLILGLVARSALANLFAGIQIALADVIRVGDVIQVGSDAGTVDEITLTYVVITLWDERRLMIPSDYFMANEFQNWTRRGNQIRATVTVDLDWRVPVDGVEAAVRAAAAASGLWDQRSFSCTTTNVANGVLTLRMVASTIGVDHMFQLQSVMNGAVVAYVTALPSPANPSS
jgi:small-conductance mechanosensitive channel